MTSSKTPHAQVDATSADQRFLGPYIVPDTRPPAREAMGHAYATSVPRGGALHVKENASLDAYAASSGGFPALNRKLKQHVGNFLALVDEKYDADSLTVDMHSKELTHGRKKLAGVELLVHVNDPHGDLYRLLSRNDRRALLHGEEVKSNEIEGQGAKLFITQSTSSSPLEIRVEAHNVHALAMRYNQLVVDKTIEGQGQQLWAAAETAQGSLPSVNGGIA